LGNGNGPRAGVDHGILERQQREEGTDKGGGHRESFLLGKEGRFQRNQAGLGEKKIPEQERLSHIFPSVREEKKSQ